MTPKYCFGVLDTATLDGSAGCQVGMVRPRLPTVDMIAASTSAPMSASCVADQVLLTLALWPGTLMPPWMFCQPPSASKRYQLAKPSLAVLPCIQPTATSMPAPSAVRLPLSWLPIKVVPLTLDCATPA